MQEVYLIRHGSVQNPQGLRYGRKEGFPLSERGIAEAGQAARFLAERAIDVIYYSPLERCAQTASIIASSLNVPAVESGEINEWDGSESIRDVQARMNAFWMTLDSQGCKRPAVVSHRDPLRALMLGLAGRKLSEVYKPEVFQLEPGGVWLLRPGMDETSFENIFTPADLTAEDAGQE